MGTGYTKAQIKYIAESGYKFKDVDRDYYLDRLRSRILDIAADYLGERRETDAQVLLDEVNRMDKLFNYQG